MDKITIKFFADLLYARRIINGKILDAIYDAKTPEDLDEIIDKVYKEVC